MYSREDERMCRAGLKKYSLWTAAFVLSLMAIYVLGAVKGLQWMMYIALAVCFCGVLFMADIWLMPRMRYLCFLRDMQKGLRRSVQCRLVRLDEAVQMQDGVRVRALQVELCADGDGRLFYVNASKLDLLPEMGKQVQITSYGRHVVECMEA